MSNEEGSSSQLAVLGHEITVIAEQNEPILSRSVKTLLQIADSKNIEERFSPIYTVPNRLREVSPSSFTPRVVSIGPIHSGRANLKLMQDKKATYLDELLTVACSPERGSRVDILTRCEEKVSASINKIEKYYFGLSFMEYGYNNKHYDDDEITLVMIMDACFILQFINKLSKYGNSVNLLHSRNIALDLVLLENQIPFFVLQDVYDLTLKELDQVTPSLTIMLKGLLELVNPFEESLSAQNVVDGTPRYHVLGLLHELYKPNFPPPVVSSIPRAQSAIKLDEFGVKIRPNINLTWPLEIEFEKSMFWLKPTLKVPVVRIDSFFEVVLRNLIAYEQHSEMENYVTSYAMAMHMLAASPKNIDKLGKLGIIINDLGSNEKASDLILSVCENVIFQDFYYGERWDLIVLYHKSYWAKNFKVFTGTYIDTPWKVIGLLAAAIVVVSTVGSFVTPFFN